MISSEVQRTLVKSPPELWAELSDPTALARHLGELGEIRIVRTEPERTVEWAADNTTGTVSIKPSGWGTKVTLSASRETTERARSPQDATAPQPTAESPREDGAPDARSLPSAEALEATSPSEPEAASESESESESEFLPEPEPDPAPASAPELEVLSEPETEPAADLEPSTRRGFFARLFARRRKRTSLETPPAEASAQESSADRADAFAAVRQVLAPETFAASHPFAALPAANPAAQTSASHPETRSEPGGDIAAELMAAEEVTAEEVSAEVTAVLTAVLDRLGAAHHRPFSRA